LPSVDLAAWYQWAMEPALTELDPATVEAIAARVAELIAERAPARTPLVDPAELARVLGVERDWVYRHAARLGAISSAIVPAPRCASTPTRSSPGC
jgi:hypothetical protein